MRFKLFCINVLTFVVASHATYAVAERVYFNSWSKGDGYLYQNYVEKDDLQKMPSWSSESGTPPPLSAQQAVAIAEKYIEEKNPEASGATVATIQLSQFLIPQYYKDKWVYNVVFMTNIPVTNQPPGNYSVSILMDGTISQVEKKALNRDREVLKKMRDNLNKELSKE